MGLKTDKDQKRYLYILKDGKLHEKVEEGTDGAKKRVFENKDDNTTVEKWEMSYPGIVGMITGIQFRDSKYGTNINIDIKDEDENEFVLSLKASSKYGESFMEALPNLDLNQEIDITTYSFPDKKNPERRIQGMTIKQDEEKVRSYFNIYNEETKTWSISVKDYPTPDAKKSKTWNSEKWKVFFAMRNEWLKDYMVDNDLIKAAEAGADDEDEPETDEKKKDEDDF